MIRRCSKGHWYDTSTNKVCPHCKLESEKLGIGIQDVEEDDRTISIAVYRWEMSWEPLSAIQWEIRSPEQRYRAAWRAERTMIRQFPLGFSEIPDSSR